MSLEGIRHLMCNNNKRRSGQRTSVNRNTGRVCDARSTFSRIFGEQKKQGKSGTGETKQFLSLSAMKEKKKEEKSEPPHCENGGSHIIYRTGHKNEPPDDGIWPTRTIDEGGATVYRWAFLAPHHEKFPPVPYFVSPRHTSKSLSGRILLHSSCVSEDVHFREESMDRLNHRA